MPHVIFGKLSRLRTITFCIPLLGCLNGDFGRVKSSLLFTDDIHAWVGRDAALQQGIQPSEFRLTDEEHTGVAHDARLKADFKVLDGAWHAAHRNI